MLLVVSSVGGDLLIVVARQDLLSVSEVDGPEAVVTADLTEHLIVPPPHSKELVVEEDILESAGVLHCVEVDSGKVVFSLRLGL